MSAGLAALRAEVDKDRSGEHGADSEQQSAENFEITLDAEETELAKKKPAAQFQPSPDRRAELPSDDFQLMLQEAVKKLKISRVRNAGRNAIAHIKKAWVFHPVDSEMSAFRAITAEEEAASSWGQSWNCRWSGLRCSPFLAQCDAAKFAKRRPQSCRW